MGCVVSNPLWRKAAGQSSRKSTRTVRRVAVGTAPNADMVVSLKSMTSG
ncbi:hypothetical protein I551_1401 [Mycobacterium ulcerans str. Harvey]|uniref:Uncharacterized protein n=1 Tax=Mycobacterium ulcerans str. Harvey TaxID=1299332 RepID=A0ABP3AQQ9_MYCUL|nr:hypothetical protein I551_1401 [Mycobacterium ulcerans str. Harvey]